MRNSPVRVLAALATFVLAADSQAEGPSWKRIGPFVEGGYAASIVPDPVSASTAYALSGIGVFRTTDGGIHWDWASLGLPLVPLPALAIDPSAPATLFVASYDNGVFRTKDEGRSWVRLPNVAGGVDVDVDSVGTLYLTRTGGEVLRSADHGETWSIASQGLDGNVVFSLAVAPSAPSVLYAAMDTGIFRSIDGGTTWNPTSGFTVSQLEVDPRNSDVVYSVSNYGVYRSEDAGATWTGRNGGLSIETQARGLVIDPTEPATLYLMSLFSVFRSTDGGGSWTAVSTEIAGGAACAVTIAVGPAEPNSLWLSSECSGDAWSGIFKSVDQGASWVRTDARFAPSSVWTLIPDAGSSGIFVATDRGVYRATSVGQRWTASAAGLDGVDVRALVQAPSDASTLYAADGSGNVYRTTSGGLSWTQASHLDSGQAGPIVVDPSNSNVVYAGSWETLARSEDGGVHWSAAGTFQGVSAISFAGARLFVGTSNGEIWASTTDGAWELVQAFDFYQGITAIVADPNDTSVVYAGWFAIGLQPPLSDPVGGVFKSTDGGLTWMPVFDGLGVTCLVMSPDTSAVLAGGARSQVLRSKDGGVTWESITGTLPDGWVSGLAINPSAPSVLYAGMLGWTSGVFARNEVERQAPRGSGTRTAPRTVQRPN